MKKNIILIFLISIFAFSCSHSSPPSPQEENTMNSYGSHLEMIVTGHSVNAKKQSFLMDSTTSSLQDEELGTRVSQALEMDGYTLAKGSEADLLIKFSLRTEKPITGISLLGRLTPYKHILNVQAFREKKQVWDLTLTSPSEDERAPVPAMLAGGLKYFGQSTNGVLETLVPLNDPRISTLSSTKME